MKMKRLILMAVVAVAAMAVQAQDDVLRKYKEMGDVNSTYVSKGMLDSVPLDQLNVPGLSEIISKIENMTLLVSMGDKAGKAMGTKLPGQLMSHGFAERMNRTEGKRSVRVFQSEKDPKRAVMVLYEKPRAVVVSLTGDFSLTELNSLGQ